MSTAHEPDPAAREFRQTAEALGRLLIWLSDGKTLEDRGLRATVALYCVRPDLIGGATLEQIGLIAGRSRQSVHQLVRSFRACLQPN